MLKIIPCTFGEVRYDGGAVTYLEVLDARVTYLIRNKRLCSRAIDFKRAIYSTLHCFGRWCS